MVNSSLRILLLEDDPSDAELVRELLAEQFAFEVTRAQTQNEFLAALEASQFDVILADYRLPSFDGISALQLTLARCPSVPFIFVSGTIGEDAAIEALKRGATDYVLKTRLSRLVPSVQRALREAEERARLEQHVTERRKAEEALRRSEAYLAEAQKLSHSGAFAFNSQRFLYWSDELYRIWGFDPGQGIPRREVWWERVHLEDRDGVRRQLQDALDQRRDYAIEYRIVLPDGTRKHLHSIGHPSYSDSGELIEVVGTTIDVTERKRAQEERERVRQLETDVAHLNRLGIMGELTASLAHEILHPIGAARNHARSGMRLLEMNPSDLTEAVDAIACAVRDIDRAKEIVGRIRDHIKKVPAQKKPIDLNEAIDEVIVMVQDAIYRNRVLVRTHFSEPALVEADRVQLQQVMLNLILNAVEAMSSMEEGPRELAISYTRSNKNEIFVDVRDSGPGIDPERLQEIFKAFYTTKSSGTGMGLSICRSIIDAHGGRLWAEPNQPRGAVFRFVLPAAE
ncbi:PAS domain S-box-containing protein [Bradyrhizobium niftali]|uniref:hybrid sensor histidine kinase/response regulator n=1 Tax=Bradyrhizobium niftali TaxID=2560055 RepID=UPI0038380130